MRTLLILAYRIAHTLYRSARAAVLPLILYGRSCQVQREFPGVIALFQDAGIPYWLGGGIAYDALRGKLTRPHKDIDISILAEHAPRVIQLLETAGYAVRQGRPTSFVAIRKGMKIDLFSWQLNGDQREMLYDTSIASVPADLFERRRVARIYGLEVRLTPPALFHLFLPLIKNKKDVEFVKSLPLGPDYKMVSESQHFKVKLPCKRIEHSVTPPGEASNGAGVYAERGASTPQ